MKSVVGPHSILQESSAGNALQLDNLSHIRPTIGRHTKAARHAHPHSAVCHLEQFGVPYKQGDAHTCPIAHRCAIDYVQ